MMNGTTTALVIVTILLSATMTGCKKSPEQTGTAETTQAEAPRQQTSPQEANNSSGPRVTFANGLFRLGTLSVALCSIDREDATANLSFVAWRTGKESPGVESVPITLVDDHANTYTGELKLAPCTGLPLRLLPVGFQYVTTTTITIPKPAPIETVQLGTMKGIEFNKLRTVKPDVKSDFADTLIQPGGTVPVGKFLSFTFERMLPDIRTWAVSTIVKNNDYNESHGTLSCMVQFVDGKIVREGAEPSPQSIGGSATLPLRTPLKSLLGRDISEAKTLLLLYGGASPDEMVLRFWPISPKDLPVRVGQGTSEDVFVEAYQSGGGLDRIGDPVGAPHWYGGDAQAKDHNDLIIQEFSGSLNNGKCAILWDQQNSARRAHVLFGPILEKYTSLGGPYFKPDEDKAGILGPPISADESSSDDLLDRLATNGVIAPHATFRNGIIVARGGVAVVLAGRFYACWTQQTYPKSRVGCPTSDVKTVSSGARGSDARGLVQSFASGHIYYWRSGKRAGQFFATTDDVDRLYSSTMSGASSWLGFPITDCYRPALWDSDQCCFEAGYIASAYKKPFEAFHYEAGLIAFVSDRDGNQEIYVTDASGMNATNLTKHPANDWAPSWSPDGSKIAFVSDRQTPGIYIMEPDGTQPRFVTEGDYPAWLPDGQRIIFCKPVEYTQQRGFLGTEVVSRFRLFSVKVDGSEIETITPNTSSDGSARPQLSSEQLLSNGAGSPDIAANGSKMAFCLGRDTVLNVFLMNIDGTYVQLLGELFGNPSMYTDYPALSPSGTSMAFIESKWDYGPISRRSGILYIADLDKPRLSGPLSQTLYCTGGETWAPDGSAIAFGGYKQGYYDGEKHVNLHIVYLRGGIRRRITEGQGNNYDPSWTRARQQVPGTTYAPSQADAVRDKDSPDPPPARIGSEPVDGNGQSTTAAPGSPREAKPEPQENTVVATVNGTNITESQVQKRIDVRYKPVLAKLAAQSPDLAAQQEKILRQNIANDLVIEMLLDEQVKQAGLQVTEEELQAQMIKQLAAQNPPMTIEQYRKSVEAQGGDFDVMRGFLSQSMKYHKLLESKFAGARTPDAIRKYIDSLRQGAKIVFLSTPDTPAPQASPSMIAIPADANNRL